MLPAGRDSTSTDDEECLCIVDDAVSSSSACSTPCPPASSADTDTRARDVERGGQQEHTDIEEESVVVLLEGRQSSPTLSVTDDGYCSSSCASSSLPDLDQQLPFEDFDNVGSVMSLERSSELAEGVETVATAAEVSSRLGIARRLDCPLCSTEC